MHLKTVHTENVTSSSGSEKISGFLALPQNKGLHWGVIAIHEWWGLDDWMKEQARDLAVNGYVVLAVDLYRGKVTAKPAHARMLKHGLPQARAIRDLKSAFNHLVARPDVNPEHIGSIGWSMGGSLALQLAIHEPRLTTCVVNYGMPLSNPAEIQKINARVLGNFGGLDRSISLRSVRTFEKTMRALNKHFDVKIYSDAGHAFANSNNKRGYRSEAAADTWARILAFFARAKQSK